MSSNTVPIQSKAASANPINWNDPVRASLPLCLKPVNWCGRQWQQLTTLDGKNGCSKICQVILRVIPAIFLSLATIFAFVVGFMGSCVSAKPVEYTLVNMQDAKDTIGEDAVKVRASILQNITQAKVQAAIDSFGISEEIMESINAEMVENGEKPLTAKEFKDQKILPLVTKILDEMATDQEKEVKELDEKKLKAKLKAELESKLKENSEASTKTKEAARTVGKSTVDTKEKTKDVTPAKDPVKASTPGLVFGKLDGAFEEKGAMLEVASLVRAANPFQRVANAFQTATPTLSEIVKVAGLDGLRTVDSQAMMKKIPAKEMKEATQHIPEPMIKELAAFISQKVMPALMDIIEPALLDPSSRAKVAQWAQNVSSVKMRLQDGQENEPPAVKIIVA